MLRKEAYNILGIPNNTSDQDVIKKAFKKKAVELHPDKNQADPNATEKFKKLNEANRILMGEEKAEDDFSFFNAQAADPFNSIMYDFFRKQAAPRKNVNKEQLALSRTVNFDQTVKGGKVEIEYTIKKHCNACYEKLKVCKFCHGEGVTHNVSRKQNFSSIFSETCAACFGKGVSRDDCTVCNNKRFDNINKKIKVEIPPIGTRITTLKLSNAGNIYFEYGKEKVGDVILSITPTLHSEDKQMRVYGDNVISTYKINLNVLLFGGTITVNTVYGPKEIFIKESSRVEDNLIINNCGVGKTGSHIVQLSLNYPKKLKKELKEALIEAYKD